MAHTDKVASWQAIQKKTFTRWANQYLTKTPIEDLTTDLSDGIKLGDLINAISEEKVRKLNRNPKFDIQKLENLNTCLDFLKQHVQLVNIGSTDINRGNEKLILGLLWTIILRFEVADADGKQGLLLWVQRSTKGYNGVNVTNFTNSFTNGLAYNALIHKYRPDLLQYDELGSENAIQNCEQAFEIAEKELGIARLLDAEDVVDSPDEKSNVAYLSQFFKKFAGQAKFDAMANAIKNAVEVSLRHDQWMDQYNEGMQQTLGFANESKEKFSAEDDSKTTEEVAASLDSFTSFVKETKPEKQAKRGECDGVFVALTSSKRNNKRPDFVPNQGLLPNEVTSAWEEMESAEQAHERKLLDKYLQFQRADRQVSKFNAKATTLDGWLDEKINVFAEGKTGSSLQEIEANLEIQNGFENRRKLYGRTFEELTTLSQEVESAAAAGHAGAQDVAAHMTEIQSKWNQAETEGASHRQKLEAALSAERNLVQLEKEYLTKLDQFQFEWNSILEVVKEFEIEGLGVAEIQALSSTAESLPGQIEGFEAKISELASIAEQIQSKHPEATQQVQDLQNQVQTVASSIPEKQASITNALNQEQIKDELKRKFGNEANSFSEYCDTQQNALGAVSGDLEEQLSSINSLREALISEGTEKMNQLAESAGQCEQMNIIVNQYTTHTINSLKGRYDQLVKSFKLTGTSIEAQLMAKKSLELSAEQIQELKEVFTVFDNDHDGTLNHQEFAEACLGIGMDVDEEQLNRHFKTKQDFTLDDFIQFFIEENKSGDSKEDVLNAFKNLGGGDSISQSSFDKFFSNNQTVHSYLSENIQDGNYVAFTEELFTR